MSENHPKIGLPKELGVFEDIVKEGMNIDVKVVKRRFGKLYTRIRGIDSKDIDVKDLVKKLKSALACGGTFKNDVVELQGNHKAKVKSLLIKFGFDENSINVA